MAKEGVSRRRRSEAGGPVEIGINLGNIDEQHIMLAGKRGRRIRKALAGEEGVVQRPVLAQILRDSRRFALQEFTHYRAELWKSRLL
jgi:hypothetical protein